MRIKCPPRPPAVRARSEQGRARHGHCRALPNRRQPCNDPPASPQAGNQQHSVKLAKLQEGKRAPVHAGAVLMLPSPLQAAPKLLPQEEGTPWDTVLASFSSLISNPKTAGGPRVVICCRED